MQKCYCHDSSLATFQQPPINIVEVVHEAKHWFTYTEQQYDHNVCSEKQHYEIWNLTVYFELYFSVTIELGNE